MNGNFAGRFAPILVLFLGSCATTVVPVPMTEVPNLTGDSTALAIPITAVMDEGAITFDHCELEVRNLETDRLYKFQFSAGENIALLEVPQGHYGYREFGCGAGRNYDLVFKNWPSPQVFPGRISVAGGILFRKRNQTRAWIGHARRNTVRREVLTLLGRLPAGIRAKVVSAYTGAPIDGSALESEYHASENESRTVDGRKTMLTTDDERPKFSACYDGEAAVNWLWLGEIPVDATYEFSQLKSVEFGPTWNTFTDPFKDCVRTHATEFRPKESGKVRYSLYL